MNTKLYRRSRLYRSLFYTKLQDRRESRFAERVHRCLEEAHKILMECYKEHYRQAMENKDYAAALEAQEDYFYMSNLLREL